MVHRIVLFPILLLFSCTIPRVVVIEDPLTPEEHLNLGVAYEKKEEFEAAIKEYESASRKLPLAFVYLGNVYFQRGDYKRAEEYYKEAIERDPSNGDAYNNLAWLYYTKRENLEGAEKLVLKAIELNPSKGALYKDTLRKIQDLKEYK